MSASLRDNAPSLYAITSDAFSLLTVRARFLTISKLSILRYSMRVSATNGSNRLIFVLMSFRGIEGNSMRLYFASRSCIFDLYDLRVFTVFVSSSISILHQRSCCSLTWLSPCNSYIRLNHSLELVWRSLCSSWSWRSSSR